MPTDAQLHKWIESALRRRFVHFSSAYWEALERAKEERWVPCKGKKLRGKQRKEVWYTCACCGKQYRKSKVQVDHIIPCVDPNVGFVTWEVFIKRLWCTVDNLQVICIPCHRKKTADERKARLPKKVRRNRTVTKRDTNQCSSAIGRPVARNRCSRN